MDSRELIQVFLPLRMCTTFNSIVWIPRPTTINAASSAVGAFQFHCMDFSLALSSSSSCLSLAFQFHCMDSGRTTTSSRCYLDMYTFNSIVWIHSDRDHTRIRRYHVHFQFHCMDLEYHMTSTWLKGYS
jgi:hypothetical protein